MVERLHGQLKAAIKCNGHKALNGDLAIDHAQNPLSFQGGHSGNCRRIGIRRTNSTSRGIPGTRTRNEHLTIRASVANENRKDSPGCVQQILQKDSGRVQGPTYSRAHFSAIGRGHRTYTGTKSTSP